MYCWVGRYAQSAGWDRVTLLGKSRNETTMRQRSMTIVSIYDLGMREAEKGTVFVTLEEAQGLYNLRNEATAVNVSLQKVGEEELVVSDLQAQLPNHGQFLGYVAPGDAPDNGDPAVSVTFFGIVVLLIASIRHPR